MIINTSYLEAMHFAFYVVVYARKCQPSRLLITVLLIPATCIPVTVASYEIEQPGCLEILNILFVKIKQAANLSTIESAGISTENVQRKVIYDLRAQRSVRAQTGHKRNLEWPFCKKLF